MNELNNNPEYQNNNNLEEIINDKNKKNNTFNTIIGISTLLIALLGATFAYFSATARSKEGDVNVKSAYVSISYDGGTEIKADNLIPATEQVAIKKYMREDLSQIDQIFSFDESNADFKTEETATEAELLKRRCIDAVGREVCYVYQFSIESDGEVNETTDIRGVIRVDSNKFDNLSYLIYEVNFVEQDGKEAYDLFKNKVVDFNNPNTDLIGNFKLEDHDDKRDDIYKTPKYNFATFAKPEAVTDEDGAITGVKKPIACIFGYDDEYIANQPSPYNPDTDYYNAERCKNLQVENKIKHTYQVMIWLEETGYIQEEQGLTFSGTVEIDVPSSVGTNGYDAGKITGKE